MFCGSTAVSGVGEGAGTAMARAEGRGCSLSSFLKLERNLSAVPVTEKLTLLKIKTLVRFSVVFRTALTKMSC